MKKAPAKMKKAAMKMKKAPVKMAKKAPTKFNAKLREAKAKGECVRTTSFEVLSQTCKELQKGSQDQSKETND